MINYSNLNKFNDLLGKLFFYGFSNHFSNIYIQESVSMSFIFKDYLDKGDDSFIDNYLDIDIYKKTYISFYIDENIIDKSNTLSMWLAEAYLRLYFRYHKAMSFIFLYLPLEKMIPLFDIYHEMDWHQLYRYFEDEISKTSLLSLLLKERNMNLKELSVLTDIKYQTLKNYTRNNNLIYNASFSNIYMISSILKVDLLIFAKKINNYLDASYLDLKLKIVEYLSFYGYRLISYLDKNEINEDATYLNQFDALKMGNSYIKTLVASNDDSIEETIHNFKGNLALKPRETYLVIYSEKDQLDESLINDSFKKIYVVTNKYFYIINKNKTKKEEIPSILHDSALRIAKEGTGLLD